MNKTYINNHTFIAIITPKPTQVFSDTEAFYFPVVLKWSQVSGTLLISLHDTNQSQYWYQGVRLQSFNFK